VPVPAPVPDLSALVDLLRTRRTVALTGAGCSTESGIPDYRGEGRVRRTSIQYREFVGSEAVRRRYWGRSVAGWSTIAAARPNAAHRALAALEARGRIAGVITQNVDGLHHAAGSRRVVELHGALARVRCLGCGALAARAELQDRLLAANPGWLTHAASAAPDGDADLPDETVADFRVDVCRRCAGVLKPDVVFFGENVPRATAEAAWALFDEAEALLVVGSSLAVFSGFRFVLRAAERALPIAIVNRGPTRGDDRAAVRVDGSAGVLLSEALTSIG